MIMVDLFSLDLILKSCYLVLFTYPATLEENVPLLKQDTWDNVVVGQMEILQDVRTKYEMENYLLPKGKH